MTPRVMALTAVLAACVTMAAVGPADAQTALGLVKVTQDYDPV